VEQVRLIVFDFFFIFYTNVNKDLGGTGLDRGANLGPFGQQEKVLTTTPAWKVVA
jgi:hypothetical protein